MLRSSARGDYYFKMLKFEYLKMLKTTRQLMKNYVGNLMLIKPLNHTAQISQSLVKVGRMKEERQIIDLKTRICVLKIQVSFKNVIPIFRISLGKKSACYNTILVVFVIYFVLSLVIYSLWQYGLWSFQTGGTKLERFLPKNQHTQRKLLNFENWVNGEV